MRVLLLQSPPSCVISERSNGGSSPGHLLGENPQSVSMFWCIWQEPGRPFAKPSFPELSSSSQRPAGGNSGSPMCRWGGSPDTSCGTRACPGAVRPEAWRLARVPWTPRAAVSLQESRERGVSAQPPGDSILQFTGSRNPYLTARVK